MLPTSLSLSICMVHVFVSPFIAFVPTLAAEQFAAVVYYCPILVDCEADARYFRPMHHACDLSSRGTFSRLLLLFGAGSGTRFAVERWRCA
jgi:hypothetical protein